MGGDRVTFFASSFATNIQVGLGPGHQQDGPRAALRAACEPAEPDGRRRVPTLEHTTTAAPAAGAS
jgi:hypothetical protein